MEVYVTSLTPDEIEDAKNLVNEDHDKIQEHLNSFHDQIKSKHPKLYKKFSFRFTDPLFMLRFLRCSKYRLKKAEDKLVTYMSIWDTSSKMKEFAEMWKRPEEIKNYILGHETMGRVIINGAKNKAMLCFTSDKITDEMLNDFRTATLMSILSFAAQLDYWLTTQENLQIYAIFNQKMIDIFYSRK